MRFPQSGVNGHHPYCLFTRVITRDCAPRDDLGWNSKGGESRGGLEQAELAGADDRRGAVLNAQFAVQGPLVGLHGVQ